MANLRGFDTDSSLLGKAARIRAEGYAFCIRYYGGSGSRVLGRAEVTELKAAGLLVGAVWEVQGMINLNYFTTANGLRDGAAAYRAALAAGQPAGSAIYFAVDTDPVRRSTVNGHTIYTVDTAGIVAYFQGAAKALASAARSGPGYAVGVYGAGLTCSVLQAQGLVAYRWLSSATGWKGSDVYADWHILQHPKTRDAATGLEIDPDEALGTAGLF